MDSKRWTVLLGSLALAACSNLDGRESKSSIGDASRPNAARAADADDEEDDDDGEAIALDQVPASVKQAAQNAVAGLVLASCEKETEDGVVVYSLTGTANGETVEVEVTASGTVQEIERGEDDD